MGRLDTIVPFQPLSRDTLKRIVHHHLLELVESVRRKHGMHLLIDARVIPYIVDDHLTLNAESGGAREALQKMESEVVVKVAEFINTVPEAKRMRAEVVGELQSVQKQKLKSDAYIQVVELKH